MLCKYGNRNIYFIELRNKFIIFFFNLFKRINQCFFEFFNSLGCPKVTKNINNGKRTIINEREVTFKCHQGYFLSTETNHFICKDDGTWNSDDLNPKCLKSKFQVLVVIGFYSVKNKH